ncbi:hypothetical protein [Salsipaludibacter albus]|uniref:hypothetical protein n=1 Tax=Salsipaludibacter albus TaxID=2849650 RepID=UPI001EE4AAFC|nr:hypothetical protein [Salsipaludibacter albus]MBY5164106.1 hypothetical protein [Salsipaludibacter albus]
MNPEHTWLIFGLEAAGWLTILFVVFATFLVGPAMLAVLPTSLILLAMARLIAGQRRHANRLERSLDAMRDDLRTSLDRQTS